MTARPFLRIAEHTVDDWSLEWRGWYVECRRPDGTVAGVHPATGLHGSQRMAFRAAIQHLRQGGCDDAAGGDPS